MLYMFLLLKQIGNKIALFEYIKLVWGGESLRVHSWEDMLRVFSPVTIKGLDSKTPPFVFLEVRHYESLNSAT